MSESMGQISAAYIQNAIRYSAPTQAPSNFPENLDQAVEQQLKGTSNVYRVDSLVGEPTPVERSALTWWLITYGKLSSSGKQYRQILRLDPERSDRVGQVVLDFKDSGEDRLVEAHNAVEDLAVKVVDKPWTVSEKEITDIVGKLRGLDHAPWKELHDDLLRWCDLRMKAVDWYKKYRVDNSFTTGRLMAFGRRFSESDESMDLTEYTKMKRSLSELYAESYSYWLVDPVELKQHSIRLFAYFKQGRHLKSG